VGNERIANTIFRSPNVAGLSACNFLGHRQAQRVTQDCGSRGLAPGTGSRGLAPEDWLQRTGLDEQEARPCLSHKAFCSNVALHLACPVRASRICLRTLACLPTAGRRQTGVPGYSCDEVDPVL
jgi:hypothetical protein